MCVCECMCVGDTHTPKSNNHALEDIISERHNYTASCIHGILQASYACIYGAIVGRLPLLATVKSIGNYIHTIA